MKYFKCRSCSNRGEANNRTAVYCCERCCCAMECFRQDDIVKSEAMIKGENMEWEAWG